VRGPAGLSSALPNKVDSKGNWIDTCFRGT
jgi:hypothetical protein